MGEGANRVHESESPIPDMLKPGRHRHDPNNPLLAVELPGQAVQTRFESLKKKFILHTSHVIDPAADVQFAGGHAAHNVELEKGAIVPAAHGVQVAEFGTFENVPAGQTAQGEDAFTDEPAGQGGAALRVHTSESPEPDAMCVLRQMQVAGCWLLSLADEVELPGQALQRALFWLK